LFFSLLPEFNILPINKSLKYIGLLQNSITAFLIHCKKLLFGLSPKPASTKWCIKI